MRAGMQVIAVLDDEPEMRKALRRLLTTQSFSVEEYESGKEFLSALDSHMVQCLLRRIYSQDDARGVAA